MKELLQLGSWERFFWPVLGVSLCHPLVGRSALKRSGFHILCLCFWRGLCVYPSSQRRSGSWPFFFWPCCLSPSPGDRSASAASRCFFSPGRFMHWSSTHGGLLADFSVRAAGVCSGCLRFSASLLSRA